VAYYEYGARALMASDLATLRLDAITSQHAVAYASKQSGVWASTVNCALRTLSRALNLGVEWGKLTSAARVPLAKGERQRDRVVTDAEWAAYIKACAQPWRDVALLIHSEGLCPGECYRLQWEHVLINGDGHGLIMITEGKTKARRRVLPMTADVYDALHARWLAQGTPAAGWVFPTRSKSGHLEQDTAKKQHDSALKASGVKRFEAYCLRHTALTRFAESGCDAFTLMRIAGHSSITMTARYCHPQAEAIERAFHKVQEVVAKVVTPDHLLPLTNDDDSRLP